MAEQSARKAQLIAELEQARAGLAENARGLKGSMNVGSHIKHAIVQQKALWLGGAVISGWLLTKLPGRKKQKAPKYIYAKAKEPDRKSFLMAALGLAATVARPALTRFATRKLTDLMEKSRGEPYSAPPPRPSQHRRDSTLG